MPACNIRCYKTRCCKTRCYSSLIAALVTTPLFAAAPPEPAGKCQATLDYNYYQRNTMAAVEGTITNKDCGASGGEIIFQVSHKDASGEIVSNDFTSSWQRKDDTQVTVKVQFPIGENVDLSRVRVRRISCTCAETAAP